MMKWPQTLTELEKIKVPVCHPVNFVHVFMPWRTSMQLRQLGSWAASMDSKNSNPYSDKHFFYKKRVHKLMHLLGRIMFRLGASQ